MKSSPANQVKVRRKLLVNPWLEEFATVPLKFKLAATPSSAIKCVRKWESWRNPVSARKPPSRNRLADEWM